MVQAPTKRHFQKDNNLKAIIRITNQSLRLLKHTKNNKKIIKKRHYQPPTPRKISPAATQRFPLQQSKVLSTVVTKISALEVAGIFDPPYFCITIT